MTKIKTFRLTEESSGRQPKKVTIVFDDKIYLYTPEGLKFLSLDNTSHSSSYDYFFTNKTDDIYVYLPTKEPIKDPYYGGVCINSSAFNVSKRQKESFSKIVRELYEKEKRSDTN